jgi:hypothetical protein
MCPLRDKKGTCEATGELEVQGLSDKLGKQMFLMVLNAPFGT